MEDFGYNLARESVHLALIAEEFAFANIGKINANVESLTIEMEDIEAFLDLIERRTRDSHRLDLNDAEDQQRVDDLRNRLLNNWQTRNIAAEIFPHGKYDWKEEEIEKLTKKLNQHVEGPLQRTLNMEIEKMVHKQNELTKIQEIFKSGFDRMSTLMKQIVNNMKPH